MIRKLESEVSGYDLCIVGAGPAGLTLTAELADTGLKICVLESGAARSARFTDALKEVQSDQLPIKEDSRERLLGGASNVWGGGSSPLDGIDYEARPWNSGWPFKTDELEPYLEAAAQRYRFPDPAEFSRYPPQFSREEWQGWSLEGLREKLFIIIRPVFHFASLRGVFDRNGVDLLVQATVTKLVSEVRGGRRFVTEALCRTPEAKSIRVRAHVYVLAAGGIENPRLLLISDLGNEYDQVGRHFMNHPRGYSGVLSLRSPLPAVNPYLTRTVAERWFYAGLALSPERQHTEGLLNSYVRFEPLPIRSSFQRHALGIWRRLPAWLAPLWALLQPRKLRLRWYAEMEPRAENRVTLSGKNDAFGTPFPLVSYSLSERDKKTLVSLHAQLRNEIERLGLGQIEGSAEAVIAAVNEDASHHMGGTRMGGDPTSSVVDANCRVHSVENLYVGGSSVFPSGGSVNPTYILAALAIRLAQHLRTRFAAADRTNQNTSDFEQRRDGEVPRSNIVIIGAGSRVAGDVMHALGLLQDEYSIVGIYARRAGTLAGAPGAYAVRPFSELTETVLQKVRFVYVAVPREAVAEVLTPLPDGIEVILDTPVPLSLKLYRRLRRFSKVHIAEDSVCMPWIAEARKKYAEIRRLDCWRSVSRCHGIAIVKALCGPIRWGWRWGNTIHLRAGSAHVRITEPRDYKLGTFSINGNKLDVVSHMHRFKREGLVRMLRSIHRGESPWPLEAGRNDEVVDRLLHQCWIYVALK